MVVTYLLRVISATMTLMDATFEILISNMLPTQSMRRDPETSPSIIRPLRRTWATRKGRPET